jgi:beta-lactamase class A
LPKGIAVGHKTGSIIRIQHDAGIVYAPRPYVLVVLVRGIDDQKKGTALIAAISRTIWEGTRAATSDSHGPTDKHPSGLLR